MPWLVGGEIHPIFVTEGTEAGGAEAEDTEQGRREPSELRPRRACRLVTIWETKDAFAAAPQLDWFTPS
jgi:hypothetical protein